jgi:hypothetical protein
VTTTHKQHFRAAALKANGPKNLFTLTAVMEAAHSAWVDPFVGLRWIAQLTDGFLLVVRGDVGGFAIYDDASELAWNVFAGPELGLHIRF